MSPTPLKPTIELIPPALRRWLPHLFLALAVFVVYGNVYGNAFLFDDDFFIVNNALLREWNCHILTAPLMAGAGGEGGEYRPLQNIIYYIVYQLADGPSLVAFHVLNIVLQAINACLVYVLGRKLGFDPRAVFCAALIWAVHPVHTEVIAYMSGTADPLYVCFFLAGLIVLLPDFTTAKIIAAIPLFILSLLAKENAVVFPALATLCIFLLKKDRLNFRHYLCTLPFWIFSGLYAWWRLAGSSADTSVSYSHAYALRSPYLKSYAEHISLRIYTALATLPAYLGILVWPTGLRFGRVFPVFAQLLIPEVLEGFALFAASTAQIIWGKARRGVALSWGLLWFGVSLFPNTGILVFVNALFLEHWMYLPSIGLFLGIAETMATQLKQPRQMHVAALCVAVIVVALSARTLDQNTLWRDPVVFNQNILKYEPNSARAHGNLGQAYLSRGDFADAIDEFHKAITISDSFVEVRNNLAVALIASPDREKNIPEAIANLNRALEIDPNYYRSYEVLAIIYSHIGDLGKSKYYFEKSEQRKEHVLK